MRKEDLMMKFRKNQNKEKQIPKEKKPRVYKVNPHKKVVIALWVLLGLSFSFAIFKHFTAIDTHTIHETTIIEKEYVDTQRTLRKSTIHGSNPISPLIIEWKV